MRHRMALILQAIAGAFGLYGIGRLIMGQWARGLAEFFGGIVLVVLLLRMMMIAILGREIWDDMGLQALAQVAVSALLTWSLWRDVKRQDEVESE